jgi:hypothetical protein
MNICLRCSLLGTLRNIKQAQMGGRCIDLFNFLTRRWKVAGNQIHALTTLAPGKSPSTHYTGRMCLGADVER